MPGQHGQYGFEGLGVCLLITAGACGASPRKPVGSATMASSLHATVYLLAGLAVVTAACVLRQQEESWVFSIPVEELLQAEGAPRLTPEP